MVFGGSGRKEGRFQELSPTIFREGGFRFYFFSREESRRHVHVYCERGEGKFWMEPQIELAQNYGLSDREIQQARNLIKEHTDEIQSAWRKHFGS
jgi:hypothetical protein